MFVNSCTIETQIVEPCVILVELPPLLRLSIFPPLFFWSVEQLISSVSRSISKEAFLCYLARAFIIWDYIMVEREHQGRVKVVRKRREGEFQLVESTSYDDKQLLWPKFWITPLWLAEYCRGFRELESNRKNYNPATTHWGYSSNGEANAEGVQGQSCEFCREVIWNHPIVPTGFSYCFPTHKTKDLKSIKHSRHWL